MADTQNSQQQEAIQQSKIQQIGKGFKIISMKMKSISFHPIINKITIDAHNGEVLWHCDDWNVKEGEEKKVVLPKQILQCDAVSREMVFSSEEEIKDFQLLQKIYLNDQEIEQLYFRFGFVIPKSQNSWDQIIQADTEGMIPAEVLSGNLLVETLFLSQEYIVHKTYYRIFYE